MIRTRNGIKKEIGLLQKQINELIEELDFTENLSACCGVAMPNYPDNDLCYRCREHTSIMGDDEEL